MNMVTIPKKEYEFLKTARRRLEILEHVFLEEVVNEEDILRWSREARELKRKGKLSILKSLKSLR